MGPSLTIPTATSSKLDTEKWSAGLTAVVLAQPGPWVVGSLVRQLWSFAGNDHHPDVNQLLIQPFVNYNFGDGWYAVSSPVLTANWDADRDNRWTVPLGGGFGKLFHLAGQPINAQLQVFGMSSAPNSAPIGRCAFRSSSCFRSEPKRSTDRCCAADGRSVIETARDEAPPVSRPSASPSKASHGLPTLTGCRDRQSRLSPCVSFSIA